MIEKQTVLAVGAHADDVEFNMAGTLALLAKAGFEPHIMNLARCDLDSNELPPDEMERIRSAEAEQAAKVLGAVYHPAIVPDMMVFYEDKLLRQVAAIVREVRPFIVLLPSLNDYMEDHMNTARLVVSACFVRGMRNYATNPPRERATGDIYLYHAQPHLNRDGMRNLVVPEAFVDITGEMPVKSEMLACYRSQWQWLKETQGLDNFLGAMRDACAEVGRLSGVPGVEYAEGFRRHSHVGYAADNADPLTQLLGDKVVSRRP